MKFAFYSCMTGMPWGGSEELWSRTAHALLADGHEVTINYRWWPNESANLQELRNAGANVWLREEPYRPNWTSRLVNRIRNTPGNNNFGTNNRIKEWLDKEKPDFMLVTVGYHPDRIAPAEECIRRKIPYAINVQCASVTTFISDSFLEDFRTAYGNAARVFFVSQENRVKVETNIAMQLENAEHIDNPFKVSTDARPAWPADQPLSLACLGRIHFMSKGQDLLVHLLRQNKWRDRDLRVHIYGKTQGNRKQLKELIDLYDLKDKIQFSGFNEDIEEIWSKHHGLILPSRYEGAPLVVTEAMLCNRICVTTDIGRNRQLIDENETGFVAAAPTVEFLDDALERAWQMRDRWQEMGDLAGKRIRERHSLDPVGDLNRHLVSLATAVTAKAVAS